MGMDLVAFKGNLKKLKDGGELALPTNVSPEAFQNAAIVAFTDNPAIANCTPQSIFKAVRRLAGMGLVPDGIEAAIVPFKNEAQAMPMYVGLIKRARNSGEIKSLWAEVVYEGETVEVWIEDGEKKWNHVRADGNRINPMDRGGEITGAYAVAKLKDDSVDFEAMAKQEIEKVRAVSRAKDGPAWKNWYSEMAKKSAIRRLAKRLPISAEDRRVIIESDEDTIGMRDVTPSRPTLQERIEKSRESEPVEGEVLPAEAQVPPPDPEQGFPGDAAFTEGAQAFAAGTAYEDNPYAGDLLKTGEANSWAGGWVGAQQAKEGEDA